VHHNELSEEFPEDFIPPTTTLVTTPPTSNGLAGWYTVPVSVWLEALDNEGGVGVAEIFVADDSTGEFQPYNESLDIVDRTTSLAYFSIDGYGNKEDVNTLTLKVDTIPPSVYIDASSQITEGETFYVDGSSSTDALSGISIWLWDFGDGGTADEQRVAYNYAENGLYDLSLSVMDAAGLTDSQATVVEVGNADPIITSITNNGPIAEGDVVVTVSVNASDAGGFYDPLTYEFDCNNDNIFEIGIQSGNIATCSFADDGSYLVNVRVTDDDGGETTDTATVIVYNVTPTIALSGAASVDEGSPYTLNLGAVTDPGDDTVTEYIVHWGDGETTPYSSVGNVDHTYVDGSLSPTITVDLVDEDGTHINAGSLPITVNNVAPTIDSIMAPDGPVDINELPISMSVYFSDPGLIDTHDVSWDWGDGSDSDFVPDVSSPTSQDHIYAEPGTYTVIVTVTDKDEGFDSATYEYIVIYDPEGGFVTGGGWINSPLAAYTADPSLTGKANFGFVSKYKKEANTPTGNTEFQFKTGDLNFHSDSYDWLVVAGAKAKFKGSGTINGSGNYGFMLSAIDAAETPSTDVDMFRIKIWDKNNGDAVVYDNNLGDGDDADPTTAIGKGNIIVHKSK
jgi:PKD repeat protein